MSQQSHRKHTDQEMSNKSGPSVVSMSDLPCRTLNPVSRTFTKKHAVLDSSHQKGKELFPAWLKLAKSNKAFEIFGLIFSLNTSQLSTSAAGASSPAFAEGSFSFLLLSTFLAWGQQQRYLLLPPTAPTGTSNCVAWLWKVPHPLKVQSRLLLGNLQPYANARKRLPYGNARSFLQLKHHSQNQGRKSLLYMTYLTRRRIFSKRVLRLVLKMNLYKAPLKSTLLPSNHHSNLSNTDAREAPSFLLQDTVCMMTSPSLSLVFLLKSPNASCYKIRLRY